MKFIEPQEQILAIANIGQVSNNYSKTCLKQPLSKRPKIVFQYQLLLNAGQGEHSAILLTFIKLPFVKKIFVLSIFEWPLKTGFTAL